MYCIRLSVLFLCLACVPLAHTLCIDGHFLDTNTQICTICPAGYSCPNDELDDKIPCAPGSAQPNLGELGCVACEANQFANVSAQTRCFSCGVQFKTPPNSTSCSTDCSDGYYQEGVKCIAVATCDRTTQYYTVLSTGQRQCQLFSPANCNISYTPDVPCTVGGIQRFCRFRYNYILHPLNGTNNRECVPGVRCSVGAYMYREQRTDSAGVLLRSQECREYTPCSPGHYYFVNGSITEDRDNVCLPWTSCDDDHYESSAPDQSRDRECLRTTTCNLQKEYVLQKGDNYTNTICAPKTTCLSNQFEIQPANDSVNRVTNGTDTVCHNHSECAVGQGINISGIFLDFFRPNPHLDTYLTRLSRVQLTGRYLHALFGGDIW
jgi:hypothetical protein